MSISKLRFIKVFSSDSFRNQSKIYLGFLALLIIVLLIVLFHRNISRIDYGSWLMDNSFDLRFEFLVLTILLMPLNWYLEFSKFTQLSKLNLKYSNQIMLKSLVTGIGLSAITPFRSGDYGGRLIWINKKDWPAAISAMFWGNWCQLQWLLNFGILGIIYFTNQNPDFHLPYKTEVQILLALVIILLIILWFYLRFELFVVLFSWLPFKSKIRKLYINYLHIEDKTDLFKVLILAGLRYFTYIIQNVLLLCFFGSKISFYLLLSGVSVIFFIHAVLPVLSWLGLIGRTGIAIFVLNKIGVAEIHSSLSSVLLWIINILLPSFLGVYFLIKKFLKEAYEKQDIDHK